ncbi:MaoC family dehydratase N-terminal domain-containing protein [Yimella sp. cx-573]|nr:MaoC family dehydratase N-terminal domain-containing protein [Yimella sp. cx-573]
MPVNPDVEGRTYPAIPTYSVSRTKIAEFAAAVGAKDPVHTDVEHARSLGYQDVVAPPTFAVIIAQQAEAAAITDPEAGIDFSRLVHGEESFTHHRPLVAGDEVTAATTVDRVRSAGGHSMVTLKTAITTLGGAPLCDVNCVVVIRGGQA